MPAFDSLWLFRTSAMQSTELERKGSGDRIECPYTHRQRLSWDWALNGVLGMIPMVFSFDWSSEIVA